MKKLLLIKDLVSGSTITDVFLLTSATQGQAKNGPYWRLELRDASGSISGKVWSPLSLEYTEMPVGEFLQISARVSSYRDKLELAVIGIDTLSTKEQEELSLADFVPSSPYNPATMMQELKELCKKELLHKPWHDFVFGILEDAEIAKRLLIFPAAKGMHHAYASGLLEHTLSVCRLCLMLSDHYPWLDRQLLIAGAICHDLGKIWELTSGLTIDYTDEGRLIGHISLVLERIKPFISLANLDDALVLHLNHLILSHHGTLEFGSPKVPSTPEAMMLHYADNIDAKMQQMRTALASLGDETGWSSYVPSLDRFLYQAEPTPKSEVAKETLEERLRSSLTAERHEDESLFEPPCNASEETLGSSFSSESASDSCEAFAYSPDDLNIALSEAQSTVFIPSRDFVPTEDVTSIEDDIPSFSYEEMRFSSEKERTSSSNEISISDKSEHNGCDNTVQVDEDFQKEVLSIASDSKGYDAYPHNEDSLQEECSISDQNNPQYSSHDEDLPQDYATFQNTAEIPSESIEHSDDDNTLAKGNFESSSSEKYLLIEKNSGTPEESSTEQERANSSSPLDGMLIAENNSEKTSEKVLPKSKSSPQVLSLLDHCS